MDVDLEALFRAGAAHGSGWRRMPAVAGDAMIATSHPLASAAGLEAFRAGGNAVDAALAAAVVLTVAEPTDNGPGGDAFAIVWHDGDAPRAERLRALAGPDRRAARRRDRSSVGHRAGRRPRLGRPRGAVRPTRPRPGARARRGARVTRRRLHGPHRAQVVARGGRPVPRARARASGSRSPTSRRRSDSLPTDGPDAFYRGRVAEAIAAACWLEEDDLAAHRSEWVEPLRYDYRGVEVCELPPNGQGAAALLALALYDGLEPGLHSQIEAMKLALADVHAYVADGPLPDELLDPAHLADTTQARRPRTRARAGPVGASSWGDDLPVRRRRRRDRDLAHPERLRDVRLRDRRARHGRRPPEPRRGVRRDGRPSEPARARDEGRSTRSSPGCSSRAVGCSGRSA